MANMSLGGVTPRANPSTFPLIRPVKPTATVKTHGGGAYFGWAAMVAGESYDFTWDYLESEDFDDFDALYVADAPVTLIPNDGSGKSYSVNIKALTGEFLLLQASGSGVLRKNVKMTLYIIVEL